MDSNLSLTISIKGQAKPNCQAVPLQEGYLKLGGIVDPTNQSNGLPFGVVVSAPAENPSLIVAGAGSGNIIRGISVYDDAIAQNAPAHPDKYLAGLPCSFAVKGLVRFDKWTTTGSNAIDPIPGAKVEFSDSTGVVEFIAATSSADSDCTVLTGATVVEVSNGVAYVWLA
jgi:hypothetical protein